MLPFLKPKPQTGVIVKNREPDEKEGEERKDNEALEACAQDLITAIHAHDVKAAAEALKAAFEVADSEPHVEGPHIEPHSYEAQKED